MMINDDNYDNDDGDDSTSIETAYCMSNRLKWTKIDYWNFHANEASVC